MRLQLILTSWLLLLPSLAAAQVDVVRGGEGGLRVYADDDHVTVVTPEVTARAPIGRRFAVEAGAMVDVVTAASIDVTSQASSAPFHDQRVEGDLTATFAPLPTLGLRVHGTGSIENDYRSLHVGGGLRLDVAQRNGTLDLDYTAIVDQVGRAGDPWFDRPRRGHRLVAGYTQVLGRGTLLDLVADGEIIVGYQASPYRYVPIVDRGGARLYTLEESVPDSRLRGAALVRLRQALPGGVFLHLDYRFYADSWAVTSHTASARLLASLADRRVTLGLAARGYLQGAASFQRANYVDDGGGAPAWRTRDRALGRVRGVTAGVVADIDLGRRPCAESPHLIAGVDLVQFWWLDFPPQHERRALIASLGITTSF